MNPTKAEVKIVTTEAIGRELEDMAEGAQKKTHMQQGAKEGLEHAAKMVMALMEHVDKDLKEGLFNEVKEPIAVAEIVKRYVKRSVGVLDNLATTAEVAMYSAMGQKAALDKAAKRVHGQWREEKEKLEKFVEAVASGELRSEDGDVSDGHPGPSLKSQRLAEEAEEAKADEGSKVEQKEPTPGEGAHSENPLAMRSAKEVAKERKKKAARKSKAVAKKKGKGAPKPKKKKG